MHSTLFSLFFVSFASATTFQFNRKSAVTTPDNLFDLDGATKELQKIRSKYDAFFTQTKRGFVEGVESTIETRSYPLNKRQTIGPLQNDNDLAWLEGVMIGSPPQGPFEMQIDTGSADFWVQSTSCQTCENKVIYNTSASSSQSSVEGKFSIEYSDGQTVSGPLVEDIVTIGTLSVNQVFSPTTNISTTLASKDYTGIIGLALSEVSFSGTANFIENAWKQGKIEQNAFGLRLGSNNDSFLSIGKPDSRLFTGQFETHQLSRDNGLWILGNASVHVNSSTITSGFETIIDSGTTAIYGPVDTVQAFYAQIPNARPLQLPVGFYYFPCNTSLPPISFSWGTSGKMWHVTAETFNLGRTSTGSLDCIGGVVGQDSNYGNVWILGDVFMRKVYTLFEADKRTVGIAAISPKIKAISTDFNGAITFSVQSLKLLIFTSFIATGFALA